MNLQLIVLLLAFNYATCDESLRIDLTLDYFLSRNVYRVNTYLCWPKIDQRRMIRKFSTNYISISMMNVQHTMKKREVDKHFVVQSGVLGVVFDSCCHKLHRPFLQKYPYFNGSYAWLILDCGSDDLLNYMKSVPLSIASDVVITKIINTQIDLYDVYNTGFDRNGEFITTYVGRWSNDRQWMDFFKKSKIRRRPSLHGLTMRVETIMDENDDNIDPHTFLMDDRQPYKDSLSRMNYQIILILKELYNFTIEFVLANNWSDKNSNGLYQPGNLLGLLDNKKADTMAAAVRLLPDRVNITDTIYLTYPFRCGIIFRFRGDFGKTMTSFYHPFQSIVWFTLLGVLIAAMIVMSITLTFENKYTITIKRFYRTLSDSILSVIGSLCQIGSEILPQRLSSRIICFLYFFMNLIIYNFYTSSIVSSLLNFKSHSFNIKDLADSHFKFGSIDTGYVHSILFDVVTNSSMDYFNKKKKTKNFYYTYEEGVEKVKQGSFGFNAEFNNVYKLIQDSFEPSQICELQEVDTITASKLAILASKGLPYTEMFRVALNKLAETGQLRNVLQKWVTRKPVCQASKSFTEIRLNQTRSSHKILYIGIALALIFLYLERNVTQ